ncbi:GGDEF domain-containing protein [Candidatus Liberibacter sp.]|uniref:GGDEF domain-containing protein n=1 Tax=Candidatus Liberibacter sp. TaxID=34022 RepID=UPI0015F39435|nr:GGDEF domain-containing protein [Candidatus Liberibacter sp.]MBA5723986.1 GGDEF domain-containing protein [Candidatus Liberibacter sp.]
MTRSLKYFLGIWLRYDKNIDDFSSRSFTVVFSIAFTFLMIIISFVANLFLFYMGFTPFYGVESFFIENISLIVVGVIISLILGYIAGVILKELLLSYSRISKLNRVDCLSGLLNHSAFISSLKHSYSTKVSIIFFDIDFFKNINDNFGHPVGDRVIAFLSDHLGHIFDKPMLVGRLGGEEFAVAALGYSEKEAAILAENLRNIIEKSSIQISFEQSIHITISAGVAERYTKEPVATAVHRADQALYAAKKSGRNRVVCFSDM